jgi:hypothetical protein
MWHETLRNPFAHPRRQLTKQQLLHPRDLRWHAPAIAMFTGQFQADVMLARRNARLAILRDVGIEKHNP